MRVAKTKTVLRYAPTFYILNCSCSSGIHTGVFSREVLADTVIRQTLRRKVRSSIVDRAAIQAFETLAPVANASQIFDELGDISLQYIKSLTPKPEDDTDLSHDTILLVSHCFESLGGGFSSCIFEVTSPIPERFLASFHVVEYWASFSVTRAYRVNRALAWTLQQGLSLAIWMFLGIAELAYQVPRPLELIRHLAIMWTEVQHMNFGEEIANTGALRSLINYAENPKDIARRSRVFLDTVDDNCFVANNLVARLWSALKDSDKNFSPLFDGLLLTWVLAAHHPEMFQELLAHGLTRIVVACMKRLPFKKAQATDDPDFDVATLIQCFNNLLLIMLMLVDDSHLWTKHLLSNSVMSRVEDAFQLFVLRSTDPDPPDVFGGYVSLLDLLSKRFCFFSVMRRVDIRSWRLEDACYTAPKNIQRARKLTHDAAAVQLRPMEGFMKDWLSLCHLGDVRVRAI